MASFKGKFRELIRLIAFPRAGNFFGKAAWSFQPDKPRGELVQVDLKVKLADEDLETEIQFLWARVGGALKIQDVLFEGDSLMKDYQNQLARIVDRDGVPGLFKKLDDRLAELSKEPKK
jgi:ABC-type transporter MlaC component